MSSEEFPLTLDPFDTMIGNIKMTSNPTVASGEATAFKHSDMTPTYEDWSIYNRWRSTKTPQWGNPARTYLDHHDERDGQEGASEIGKSKADLLNAVLGIIGEIGELTHEFGPDYVDGEIVRGVSTIMNGETKIECGQELGDILFYCVWALDSLYKLYPETIPPVQGAVATRISGWAINEVYGTRTWKEKFIKRLQDHLVKATAVGEMTKKFIFHGKPIHLELTAAIQDLLTDTILIGQSINFGARTLLNLNITKLDRRYSQGFVEGGGVR